MLVAEALRSEQDPLAIRLGCEYGSAQPSVIGFWLFELTLPPVVVMVGGT